MKLIQCEKCGKEYLFSQETMKQKQLGEYRQITIVCPHCSDETHGYFTSDTLEKKGKRLQTAIKHQNDSPVAQARARKLQLEYEHKFEKMQIEATQYYVKTVLN